MDLPRHFGFLMTWRLTAPFDNSGGKGLAAVYPPEKVLDLKAEYEGKDGKKIAWVEHTTADQNGVVDLAKARGPSKDRSRTPPRNFKAMRGGRSSFAWGRRILGKSGSTAT